jgi:NAD(P)-dependent dehydrogenase (short-subunit alcohol dehydrogenase family)
MSTSVEPTHAVVTGATGGIGLEIARSLARDGLTVTLVGRDAARLDAARASITEDVPDAHLHAERADFADLEDVRALAGRLLAGPPIDAVVSNAATIAELDARTPEGHRRAVVVNHLSPYLLLRTLAGGLSSSSRIVIVGADPAWLENAPVDLADLDAVPPAGPDLPEDVRPFTLYALTKTMNLMTVVSLARHLRGSGVSVTGAHPGIIAGTQLSKEAPRAAEAVHRTYGIDTATLPRPDVGADTPAWLVVAPELDGVTGTYYVDRTETALPSHASDPDRCERLWTTSARLVGLDP